MRPTSTSFPSWRDSFLHLKSAHSIFCQSLLFFVVGLLSWKHYEWSIIVISHNHSQSKSRSTCATNKMNHPYPSSQSILPLWPRWGSSHSCNSSIGVITTNWSQWFIALGNCGQTKMLTRKHFIRYVWLRSLDAGCSAGRYVKSIYPLCMHTTTFWRKMTSYHISKSLSFEYSVHGVLLLLQHCLASRSRPFMHSVKSKSAVFFPLDSGSYYVDFGVLSTPSAWVKLLNLNFSLDVGVVFLLVGWHKIKRYVRL